MMKQCVTVVLLITMMFGCGSSSGDGDSSIAPKQVMDEMKRWGVQPLDVRETGEADLPADIMSHAGWYLTELACQDAGYDLEPLAGGTVSRTSYATEDSCLGNPVFVNALTEGDVLICLFRTYDKAPVGGGIFSVRNTCDFPE